MTLTFGYSYALHGIGVGAARTWFSGDSPDAVFIPGLEYTAPAQLMHYTADASLQHWTAKPNILHWTASENDA